MRRVRLHLTRDAGEHVRLIRIEDPNDERLRGDLLMSPPGAMSLSLWVMSPPAMNCSTALDVTFTGTRRSPMTTF